MDAWEGVTVAAMHAMAAPAMTTLDSPEPPEVAPPTDPADAPDGAASEPSEASDGNGAGNAGDAAWSDAPYLVFSGFAMGTADVVPGVSGGTMAVALGIYAQLLRAITSVDLDAIRSLLRLRIADALGRVHLRFLVSLLFGVGLGVAIMVKVIKLPELIHERPEHVYGLFFGLVLSSAVLLARTVTAWNGARVLALLFGAVFGFAVVNLVPVDTPESPLFIFFCGVVAICAMVLPGISGSFILLILRKYAYVLAALAALDLKVILPFALGCALGITVFSRVVSWAFVRFANPVTAGLVGLLLGSLWRIWPYQHLTTVVVREKVRAVGAEPFLPQAFDPGVWGLCVVGLVGVIALERLASRRTSAAVAAKTA